MSEDNLIQCAYMSFATLELKSDADKQIEDILQEAVLRNTDAGITGELIYRNGIFLQLLEGKKQSVEHVLGKILLDHKRHESVKILFKQPMVERIFEDWSMAYVKLDDSALDFVNCIVPWQTIINSAKESVTVPAKDILNVFMKLRK